MKTKKPRVKFCWWCGSKLWGIHHVEKVVQGKSRILHKDCSVKLKKELEEVNL